MARLPVYNTRNPFGVVWICKDVVVMQVIMPEAWVLVGDGGVLWGKGIDGLFVR